MQPPLDYNYNFETLADYLRPGLAIVSIGLNPSLPSVRAGYYFANPRNRFWRALNASGLVAEPLEPGLVAQECLFHEYAIGFTDVVKRPTAGGGELRAEDFRTWAPVLRARLLELRPAIAWFHGKQAFDGFRRHAMDQRGAANWGEQPERLAGARVFVTPNPSPANAAWSLEDLVDGYRRLAALRARAADS